MRLLIFSDSNTPVPATTVLATLRAASAEPDLEVCGFVTTRPHRFQPLTVLDRARRGSRRTIVAAVNHERRRPKAIARRIDTHVLADHDVPVIVPYAGDVNSPEFRRQLERELRPDVALSYYFGTIFERPLLELLPQAVNLHPALLPRYRGLRSVEFALYHHESVTGCTFHRMTERIDDGPILVQQRVPVVDDESLASVTNRIALAAAAGVPEMLERVRSHAPGEPQHGAASYFSAGAVASMTTVTEARELTYEEFRRRIRAFGAVRLTIDGTSLRVTRLRPAQQGDRFAFETADGTIVAPDRIAGLPRALTRHLFSSASTALR